MSFPHVSKLHNYIPTSLAGAILSVPYFPFLHFRVVRFCSHTCTTSFRQQLYLLCVWSVRAGGLAVTTRPLPPSPSVGLSVRSLATFPSQFRGDVRRLFASITNDFLASRAHHFHLDTQSARAVSATNRNERRDDRLRSVPIT